MLVYLSYIQGVSLSKALHTGISIVVWYTNQCTDFAECHSEATLCIFQLQHMDVMSCLFVKRNGPGVVALSLHRESIDSLDVIDTIKLSHDQYLHGLPKFPATTNFQGADYVGRF